MADVCPDCERERYYDRVPILDNRYGNFCLSHLSYDGRCVERRIAIQTDRIRALESELAELRKAEAAALEESAIWRRDAARYEKERDEALHEMAEMRKREEEVRAAFAALWFWECRTNAGGVGWPQHLDDGTVRVYAGVPWKTPHCGKGATVFEAVLDLCKQAVAAEIGGESLRAKAVSWVNSRQPRPEPEHHDDGEGQ